MTMIPEHIRNTYEVTDEKLNELRGLLVAAQLMAEEKRAHITGTPEADALHVMHNLALAKLAELDRTRSAEWAAIGGNTDMLTPEELAAARGQAGEAAQ